VALAQPGMPELTPEAQLASRPRGLGLPPISADGVPLSRPDRESPEGPEPAGHRLP
jgi:hypothetical protein